MPYKNEPTPNASYHLLATVAVTVIVEGQSLSCQSLLDLAAVSRPARRPDWSEVLIECASVQRHLGTGDYDRANAAILVLVMLMGIRISIEDAADLLEHAAMHARRDGPQVGFSAMAHRLCVLAVQ